MNVPAAEWLELLDKEYLKEFLPGGGAAVRLAVVDDSEQSRVLAIRLQETAEKRGFCVAQINAAHTPVQRIDHLFHRLSSGLNWDQLSELVVRNLLNDAGIQVNPGESLRDIDHIASISGRSPQTLRGDIERLIDKRVLKNYRMSAAFRTAMTLLCRSQVFEIASESHREAILAWLRGTQVNLTALKACGIFEKINRRTARQHFASLPIWLHQAGYSGLVLTIDLNTLFDPRPEDLRYTTSGILDTYESLRQFIDDIDELAYLLIVVVAGRGLITNSHQGIDRYEALKMRVIDDVRDNDRPDPLGVRVSLDRFEVERGE